MPKPKLSPEQRQAIRKELKDRIDRKEPRDEAVKAVALKYELTPNAVRWYLGRVNGHRKPRKNAKRGARKAQRRRARTSRQGQPTLLRMARCLTRKQLKKLSLVQRLLPKHDTLQRAGREAQNQIQALKRTDKLLRRKYKRITAQARKVAGKLQQLELA